MQYANAALITDTAAADRPVMTIWVALVQHEASGTVRLRSSNYQDYPLIDTAYIGSEGGRAAVLRGYKTLREVLQSDELKSVIVKKIYPGPQAVTNAQLWKAIQGGTESYHHPVVTVALGTVLQANYSSSRTEGI